jgi:hypothetical protein
MKHQIFKKEKERISETLLFFYQNTNYKNVKLQLPHGNLPIHV